MSNDDDMIKKSFDFNLMIFTRTADYLCYVESVHLMNYNGRKKPCSFVSSTRTFKQDIREFPYTRSKFLDLD